MRILGEICRYKNEVRVTIYEKRGIEIGAVIILTWSLDKFFRVTL